MSEKEWRYTKSKACKQKGDIGTTKMRAMNKYNWGGIDDNRVRELEESWVSRRQETILEVYVVASSVDLLTSPGLMIWLKL